MTGHGEFVTVSLVTGTAGWGLDWSLSPTYIHAITPLAIVLSHLSPLRYTSAASYSIIGV